METSRRGVRHADAIGESAARDTRAFPYPVLPGVGRALAEAVNGVRTPRTDRQSSLNRGRG